MVGDIELIQIYSIFNFQNTDFLPIACKEPTVALCIWKNDLALEPDRQESKVKEVSLLHCTAYSHLSYPYIPPILWSY